MNLTFKRVVQSIWLFPAVLTLGLLLFTALKINGSSIGTYHDYFYAGTVKDSNLLYGQPRTIRSDEWLINTQMAIAQDNNDFVRINENIGYGQDVSLLSDAPYKEWSTIFKPHNLGFFVMPFDNAFAFRWWTMGYLLILSCYFFVLSLLPRKRLLAALLSTALFFSPFIQWLYLYGTLGVIIYSLFGGVIFMRLLGTTNQRGRLLWGLLLAYVAICFALILYPPYQIPCALAILAFAAGHMIEKRKNIPKKLLLKNLAAIGMAVALAGIITLTFLATRSTAVESIQNTVYPGSRTQEKGGGFDAAHFFSSHLSPQLQSNTKASKYRIIAGGKLAHQSEAANFILLTPFLLLPSAWLFLYSHKNRKGTDWPLLLTTTLFLLFLLRLFTAWFDWFFNLMLLGSVPSYRLIIGLGLLGIIHSALFMRRLSKLEKFNWKPALTLTYTLATFSLLVYLGIFAKDRSPGFITTPRILIFSLMITLVVYLILVKRFVFAASGFLLFSIVSSGLVNPIYRTTAVISQNPLSKEIRTLSDQSDGKWIVADDLILENIAFVNGAKSLSGVYAYPQLDIWKSIDTGNQSDIYNRYAHVVFTIDRDSEVTKPTNLTLMQTDYFQVHTEPCSSFLKNHEVDFIITIAELKGQDSCARLVKIIEYPARTIFIYELDHQLIN